MNGPSYIYAALGEMPSSRPTYVMSERKTVFRGLMARRDLQFQFRLNPSIQELSREIGYYSDQLYGFHFAGHASGQQIQLGEPVFMVGLAKILSLAPNIRLVFLNGCGTHAHHHHFDDQMDGYVICTMTEVPNGPAIFFSETFYESLGLRYSIKEAFNRAVGSWLMRYGETDANGVRKPCPWVLKKSSQKISEIRNDLVQHIYENDSTN